jgi:hypothetical protein
MGTFERRGSLEDAVMALFGVPVAHEEDTLRACRAGTLSRILNESSRATLA